TNLDLKTDEPIRNNCSGCNKCMEACPTGALMPDGQFDANKCISYLTTEYKGQIPADLAEKIGDRLFGCDECILACPYREKAPVCKNKQFKFHTDRARLNLHEILNLTSDSLEVKFADSAIKRLPLDCLKRNAKICLSNITRSAI
ncbi:MAG: epoxyqueuosine reductase, partial [Planctomycetota bacterium]